MSEVETYATNDFEEVDYLKQNGGVIIGILSGPPKQYVFVKKSVENIKQFKKQEIEETLKYSTENETKPEYFGDNGKIAPKEENEQEVEQEEKNYKEVNEIKEEPRKKRKYRKRKKRGK